MKLFIMQSSPDTRQSLFQNWFWIGTGQRAQPVENRRPTATRRYRTDNVTGSSRLLSNGLSVNVSQHAPHAGRRRVIVINIHWIRFANLTWDKHISCVDGSCGGICKHDNEPSASINGGKIFWSAERLSAF